MKTRKPTTKNLQLRLPASVYNFINDKAKEKGISKKEYLFSQFDETSELTNFLIEDEKNTEVLLRQLKDQLKEMRNSMKKDITNDLNSVAKKDMSLTEFKYVYANYINDPDYKAWIITKARKLGLDIE